MEAKDTVINREARSLIRARWLGRRKTRPIHDDLMKDVAQAQAERTAPIFLRAGRMEAVEWMSQNMELVIFPDNRFYDAWQAQLKRWGIDNGQRSNGEDSRY